MIHTLQFPKMIQGNQVKIVYGKAATMQNIKLFFQSKKSEFFGDPEYGSGIETNLYKFNNIILQNILKDQIYTNICNYFPQLSMQLKDITITVESKTNLVVTFSAFNDDTKQTDLFNIDLSIDG